MILEDEIKAAALQLNAIEPQTEAERAICLRAVSYLALTMYLADQTRPAAMDPVLHGAGVSVALTQVRTLIEALDILQGRL